ncbi:hypothetical protein [Caloranaerobacter sp. DY30410]|uniref:hypothetical protein n=1 Tax=Caloranaerobacter sp. DY30410 TaxID=3238305 RepID=UPI003D07F48E
MILFLTIIINILTNLVGKEISNFLDLLTNFILSNPEINKAILKLGIELVILAPIILKLYNAI